MWKKAFDKVWHPGFMSRRKKTPILRRTTLSYVTSQKRHPLPNFTTSMPGINQFERACLEKPIWVGYCLTCTLASTRQFATNTLKSCRKYISPFPDTFRNLLPQTLLCKRQSELTLIIKEGRRWPEAKSKISKNHARRDTYIHNSQKKNFRALPDGQYQRQALRNKQNNRHGSSINSVDGH